MPGEAWERTMIFRRGWKDAARGLLRRKDHVEHATRADLSAAYLAGYERGKADRNRADMDACALYGYTPTVLREGET
jgi:hypothetical protein